MKLNEVAKQEVTKPAGVTADQLAKANALAKAIATTDFAVEPSVNEGVEDEFVEG